MSIGIVEEEETPSDLDNNNNAIVKSPPVSVTDYKPPEFTIKKLRDVVPAHLFRKSLLRSSAYLLCNLAACAALFYLATFIDDFLPLPLIAWPAYWWFQGIASGGIWVLAHECGHRAFCDSKTINDTVGLILHSCLLVPYHSWRISHAQHHAATSHMNKDQVFVPVRRNVVEKHPVWKHSLEQSPIYTFFTLYIYISMGWLLYILTNLKSQKCPVYLCHFLPSSLIFKKEHRNLILLSDFAISLVLLQLGYLAYTHSVWAVVKYYFIPYIFVNGWLVCVTLLQHTESYIPHYSPEAWTFVRGALSTVDRDYGWFLNHALHHIMDSHVAHHLFSQMPHYNAIQATPYLKKKLGKYYLYDRTPIFESLMRSVRECAFVEDEGDVLFYKNKL